MNFVETFTWATAVALLLFPASVVLGGGFVVQNCGVAQVSPFDAVGETCGATERIVFGSTATPGAFNATADLRAVNATCSVRDECGSFSMPLPAFGSLPDHATLAYLGGTSLRDPATHATWFPEDFRMTTSGPYVAWQCEAGTPTYRTLPPKPCASQLRASIFFPFCGDGRADSPDHASHVVWPDYAAQGIGAAQGLTGGGTIGIPMGDPAGAAIGRCPAGHPLRYPALWMHVVWNASAVPVGAWNASAALSANAFPCWRNRTASQTALDACFEVQPYVCGAVANAPVVAYAYNVTYVTNATNVTTGTNVVAPSTVNVTSSNVTSSNVTSSNVTSSAGGRGILQHVNVSTVLPPQERNKTVRIFNNCGTDVYAAAIASPMPVLLNSSWLLPARSKAKGVYLVVILTPVSNAGRLWARTGCITSLTLPKCNHTTGCPSDGRDWVVGLGQCSGCSLASHGPFSPGMCPQQCVSTTKPDPWYTLPIFECTTGNCGDVENCTTGGGFATLFEWSSGSEVFYDISFVDGANTGIAVDVVGPYDTRNGLFDCQSVSCPFDPSKCPPEIQQFDPATNMTYCMSICGAAGSASQRAKYPFLDAIYTGTSYKGRPMMDLVCFSCGDCGGAASCGCDSPLCDCGCSPLVTNYPASWANRTCDVKRWPLSSTGVTYDGVFKEQCPLAYSFAFDDQTATRQCENADFDVTFCP